MSVSYPHGKTLVQGADGRLYVVSREVSGYGDTAYVLLRCETELVDAFRYRYEAVAATGDSELLARALDEHGSTREISAEREVPSLTATLPAQALQMDAAEPKDRAIVVDKDGDAWQREDAWASLDQSAHWFPAGDAEAAPEEWDHLVSGWGPVRLIWCPEGNVVPAFGGAEAR